MAVRPALPGRKRRARRCHEALRRVRAIQRVAGVLDAVHRAGDWARIILRCASRCGGWRDARNARGASDASTDGDSCEEAQTVRREGQNCNAKFRDANTMRRVALSQTLKS